MFYVFLFKRKCVALSFNFPIKVFYLDFFEYAKHIFTLVCYFCHSRNIISTHGVPDIVIVIESSMMSKSNPCPQVTPILVEDK